MVVDTKMSVKGTYLKTEIEFSDRNCNTVESGCTKTNGYKKEDKVYTYDEALDLVGKGWYTYGLVLYLILAFLGMTLDLFGYSVVVTGVCDMNITHYQKSVLLSMPLIGSIVMAWPWGYIADTQGRRRAMALSLWGSFILSTINAFSPNWIVMAVLKFASTALSSGTQSLGYTLLGESCCQKSKAPFMIIVTSSLLFSIAVYTALGYYFLGLEISVDLHFITFSNWRLLVLVLTLPLGLSALFLGFILESPKFLLNAGREKEAIQILRKIMRRNGGDDSKFPVKKIVLNETASLKLQDVPLWQSLKDQTLPLFKPPLLNRTIQLFFITTAIYAPSSGIAIWFPFIADSFYGGFNAGNGTADVDGSVCDMIVNSDKLDTDTETCVGNIKDLVLWMAVLQFGSFTVVNLGIWFLARWKKFVMIGLMLSSVACGLAIPSVANSLASVLLLNGFMLNALCVAIVFTYYVDLYPTSYRGMASCLGVMVARASAVVGCNLIGSYIASHCITSFYAWSVYVLSGAVVCLFLPSDNLKTSSA